MEEKKLVALFNISADMKKLFNASDQE